MKIATIPYQPDTDFVLNGESRVQDRPELPSYADSNHELTKPEDIPINRRNFVYAPCSPNLLFPELRYCTTEYPFELAGFNYMDRADDLCVERESNNKVGVQEMSGWRTGRCDACIKEGTVYWEVEVLAGGVPDVAQGEAVKLTKDKLNNTPHVRFGISRREASLECPVGSDGYGYGLRDFSLESIHGGKMHQSIPAGEIKAGERLGFLLHLPPIREQIAQAQSYSEFRIAALSSLDTNPSATGGNTADGPLKKKAKKLNREFHKELLREQDHFNVVRDQIAIRYKNQLFFEATDYVKTTKQDSYTTDEKERHDQYRLEGSYLKVFLNGKEIGTAFEGLRPFLPPFSEINYNEKLYFNYWRNEAGDKDENRTGFDHQRKKRILRNKYVNNGRLGYYATVSCFNGGSVKLITDAQDLQHLHAVKEQAAEIKTLNELFMEQVADDIVWDIVDEVEAEMLNT